MRLPHLLIESPFFQFTTVAELIRALDGVGEAELAEIERVAALGLPPAVSPRALATMLGINIGLVWSMANRTRKHYRRFYIPKGNTQRAIDAPRVAIKIVQRWLATHLARNYTPMPHVHGFVAGRSHVSAAQTHLGAQWVFSTDIENFFPSTPQELVEQSLQGLGYPEAAARFLTELTCLNGFLPQGAPTSPVLSNVCFSHGDVALVALARDLNLRLSRYADDIVFSGTSTFPVDLPERLLEVFRGTPWATSPAKTTLMSAPARLKVHGLLVHGQHVRLTKGYRNRLRAYRHLVANRRELRDGDKLLGHLAYADFVDRAR